MKLEAHGKPPMERHSHQMVNLPKKFMMVVIGGRNDDMFSTNLTNCFDDVHILDYKLMAWI